MRTAYKSLASRALNAALIGIGAICLAIVVFTWFQVSRNYYGMFYGVFADPPKSGFSGGEFNHFQSINTWYFATAICLLVYLAGRFLGESLTAVVLRLIALCVGTFPFMNMLMYKFTLGDVIRGYEWLATSIYLDIACLVLMVAITGLEIIGYTVRSRNSEQFSLLS